MKSITWREEKLTEMMTQFTNNSFVSIIRMSQILVFLNLGTKYRNHPKVSDKVANRGGPKIKTERFHALAIPSNDAN